MLNETATARGENARERGRARRWPTISNYARAHFPAIILLILASLIVVGSLWTLRKPLNRDVSIYAVIGHELLAGRPLYSDLLEQRPPATMVSYAITEAVAGYGPHTIYLLHVTVAVITLLGIYYAASAFEGGAIAGLWAAALWVAVFNSLALEAGEPNTEVFLNACLTWAFALFVRARLNAHWWRRALVIGALFALASVYKHIAVVCPLLLAAAHVAFPLDGSNRRRALAEVGVIAGVGALAWALLFGYFAATGRFQIFRAMMIGFNLDYAAGQGTIPASERPTAFIVLLRNIFAPLRGEAELFLDLLTPLALICAAGILCGIWGRRRRAWAMLAAFAVAAWIEIALPGQFFLHYFQLWLPPLLIGTGAAIGLTSRLPVKQLKGWLPHAVGVAVVLLLTLPQLPSYRVLAAGDWSKISGAEALSVEPVAREINTLLAPGETFYEWGANPGLYFWTQRRPPTGVLVVTVLLHGSLSGELSERVVADLQRTEPELLVITKRNWPAKPTDNVVVNWLIEHYQPLPGGPDRGPFALWVRRGSALDTRLHSSHVDERGSVLHGVTRMGR